MVHTDVRSLPSLAARARARAPDQTPRRIRLLGQSLDLVTPTEVMAHIQAPVRTGRRSLIANHNLNSLALIRRVPAMQAMYDRADLIEIDSTPLIAFGRLLGLPVGRMHRCTYLDWREDFWRMADAGSWRVFYLGGAPGVADEAARRLSTRWPRVKIVTRDGFFDADPASADAQAVRDRIADFAPHVLMVGMGMPRQELWIVDNIDLLPPSVVLPVGAAFDYEAGVQKAAPRWMGRLGVEWLYRLAHDPARLARRYLVEPWPLVIPALADVRDAIGRRR